MMKIITEIVKTVVSVIYNDGYAAQYEERHSNSVKKDNRPS